MKRSGFNNVELIAGSVIGRETSRNGQAVRYILQQADCPYRTIGKEAQYCSTTPPVAPTGLAATAVSSAQINLTWKDNSGVETGFVVARGTVSGGPYADLATLAANTTAYSNTGLAPNTAYTYRIRQLIIFHDKRWLLSFSKSASTLRVIGGSLCACRSH